MKTHPYGTNLWFIGHQVRPFKTAGSYAAADVVVTPKVPGPPPHSHALATELYYVTDGPMEFLRGGDWYTVQTGDSFLIPKGAIHSFRNNSEKPTRFLTIHDPGEPADNLFLGYGFPVDEEGSFENSVSEETIHQVIEACPANDMFLAPADPAKQ